MPQDTGRPCKGTGEKLLIEKAQLERLQRLAGMGEVSSSVAHEFNNILTTILNFAKMGMKAKDDEQIQRSFDKILGAARRAAKITTGVLALSRNRGDKKVPTDMIALVEEVLAVLEKDLVKHQVRLEKHFDEPATAEVIGSQIEQVLLNLIINARQAMGPGGVIRLGVCSNKETGMVELSVKDAGPGIPAARLARIFEPFYSTKDGPDSSGQGGSGLGLSICRDIVERHQGRIRVESQIGKGTTFTIKLPITAAAAPVSKAA